jgi:hypothetical protein
VNAFNKNESVLIDNDLLRTHNATYCCEWVRGGVCTLRIFAHCPVQGDDRTTLDWNYGIAVSDPRKKEKKNTMMIMIR